MTFITTVSVDEADGEVRLMYEALQAHWGYVPNYAMLFSHRPQVMSAWSQFLASIRASLDPRQYELVTVAAARALRNSYCSLAHGDILRRKYYSAEQLVSILDGSDSSPLSPAEAAMMDFAEKVARDAASMGQADVDLLRHHGFSDAQIFDIAAAAAARCLFSKLNDALGVEPDSALAQLEPDLQRRLAIGRPISRAPVEVLPPAPTQATA